MCLHNLAWHLAHAYGGPIPQKIGSIMRLIATYIANLHTFLCYLMYVGNVSKEEIKGTMFAVYCYLPYHYKPVGSLRLPPPPPQLHPIQLSSIIWFETAQLLEA